ncbi:MAG: hypothetical protein ACQESN_05795 [Thermotogota bacterium]
MKKGLVILVVLLVGLLAMSAYYHWNPGNPGGNGFNFTDYGNVNEFKGDVDVQIHQWISAKWVTRSQLYNDRDMVLGNAEGSDQSGMPSGIDIGRYGVYNNVFLGGLGMISNGDLKVKIEKDNNGLSDNLNDVISTLKLYSYNFAKNNSLLVFDENDHPDLWLPSAPTGEGNDEVTMMIGTWNNFGPELAVFSNLNVPWTRAPEGGKFYLDVAITPLVTFSTF